MVTRIDVIGMRSHDQRSRPFHDLRRSGRQRAEVHAAAGRARLIGRLVRGEPPRLAVQADRQTRSSGTARTHIALPSTSTPTIVHRDTTGGKAIRRDSSLTRTMRASSIRPTRRSRWRRETRIGTCHVISSAIVGSAFAPREDAATRSPRRSRRTRSSTAFARRDNGRQTTSTLQRPATVTSRSARRRRSRAQSRGHASPRPGTSATMTAPGRAPTMPS